MISWWLRCVPGQSVFSLGGDRHAGWESWQTRVYRPPKANASFGCWQKDHAYKNSGSPLRHNEPPDGLSPDFSVSVY